MRKKEITTIEEAYTALKDYKLPYAKVAVTDIDGILRGKYIAKKKLISALTDGFGFCDVILGWDSNDQLYDTIEFTGWNSGFPDAQVTPIPETSRRIPFENNLLFFLAEFSGGASALCPRSILKKVIDKTQTLGLSAFAGAEYEYFLFQETPETVRTKNYKNLVPFTPGNFGYSIIRNSVQSDFHNAFLEMCESMDIPLEGYHTETGPGVLEAAIAVDEILHAADKAILFKTFTKIFAQKHELMATFMAKWSTDYPGQSGHIHLSLQNKKDENIFFDPSKPLNISDEMRWFIGGQQKLMPELIAMVAPTVNSYRRLIPNYWAPIDNSWGIDNRTTAIRVIPGAPASQRIEYRLASSDSNPYLAMAVALGSGIWGIENEIEPTRPIQGNFWEESQKDIQPLPQSLGEASILLKKSKVGRSLFGDAFIDHFCATRDREEDLYRNQVDEWQLKRYFEII
jgi:glutamine synthetase